MNFLYWNVCGFGNPDNKIYFSYKPYIIFWRNEWAQFPSWYWHNIGVTKYCPTSLGKVIVVLICLLLWDTHFRVQFGS